MSNDTQEVNFGFGQALAYLKSGYRVARQGWNGVGQFLALQTPDHFSKMRKPYIYISPVDGELVPWLASQTDMLAEDWQTVALPEPTPAMGMTMSTGEVSDTVA